MTLRERFEMQNKFRLALAAGALASSMMATSANALTFILTDIGGVKGTAAELGFQQAADFWSRIITNNVTVRINIGFSSLGANVLGSTGATIVDRQIQFVSNRIASGGTSALDAQVKLAGLPVLTGGAAAMITPGYVDEANKLGIDTTKRVYDNDTTENNLSIGLTTANAKALGYLFNPADSDAEIQFSSDFAFDFDGSDGITANTSDFLGVAIHEIGHALGFISGADDYDFIGCPNGPACAANSGFDTTSTWWGYALDLFRYSNNASDPGPGGPQLNWAPNGDAYFSIDRGTTEFNGRADFANGAFNDPRFNPGEGDQASHWLAPEQAPFCSGFIGIMNPYLCSGRNATFTGLDVAALDAIGWNFTAAIRDRPNLSLTTRQIAQGVPEPGIWLQMIFGFGIAGMAIRVRRVTFGRRAAA
jgi:hypothetical protein